VSKIRQRKLGNRKRRIQYRLRDIDWPAQAEPMFRATNIHYELSERIRGLAAGGIGLMHRLARRIGLISEIDERVEVLKVHLPYSESDHVLNLAYNVLAGGTCMEDLELRRNDEVYLDALGTQRIPDPTTAGDFLRRLDRYDIESLMTAANETRLRVWRQQPDSFFDVATIEADGTMAPTSGECKEGMDISYKGQWGYHPLIVTMAETGEVLYLTNRSANRPSHEGAAARFDQAFVLCRRAGFRKVKFRGDTDFSQCEHLDRWDTAGVQFVFGFDSKPTLVDLAESLAKRAWKPLERRAKYEVLTQPRERPENVKEAVVVEREFRNIRLVSEDVAEFDYSPGCCEKTYRMVVLRKNLSIEKGETRLFDEVRYFFYITNDFKSTVSEIVFEANTRCNQENLIAQLHGGVRALQAPSNTLLSNWAYMVITALAWNLKAWFALLLPETGRWAEKHRREKQLVLKMEFKTFVNAFIQIPAQIIRTGRRIVFRLLAWNGWQPVFFRAVDQLQLHGKLDY